MPWRGLQGIGKRRFFMKQALALAVPVVKNEDADVSQQDKWCVPHDVGDNVCVWMEDVRDVVVYGEANVR